eukprot:2235337-Pyramimonas_sp.AAC.1
MFCFVLFCGLYGRWSPLCQYGKGAHPPPGARYLSSQPLFSDNLGERDVSLPVRSGARRSDWALVGSSDCSLPYKARALVNPDYI